jgi:hypothetical protein
MAFTGDILPHSPLWRAAERYAAEHGAAGHDFTPMLAALAPVFDQVDLAVCHLETPIAPDGQGYSTHPRYAVPAGIAVAIAEVGYDRCSTASNHVIDQGAAGIERTVRGLEENSIPQSGMARTPEEIEPTVFNAAGVAISHLSYTWSYNGLSLAPDESWRSALIDPQRILADAATARRMGAEIVVVSLHWGAEGHSQPTSYQRSIAEAITAADTVDLIVGHHAHVLQPIEQVNGTWVVFGLGNILSNLPTSSNFPDASQDAAVVTIGATVDVGGNVEMSRPTVIPTWVDKDARWTVRLVADELARTDLGAGQRGRLERSLARTLAVVGDFVEPTEPVSPVSP